MQAYNCTITGENVQLCGTKKVIHFLTNNTRQDSVVNRKHHIHTRPTISTVTVKS